MFFIPIPWFLTWNKKFHNSMYLCELKLTKNWPGDKFFNFRKLKFWERQLFLNTNYL